MKHSIVSALLSLLAACQGSTPVVQPSDAPPEDITSLAAAGNKFAIRLYRDLAIEEGNLLFSPWSIGSALTLGHAGARGDTAEEIATALALPFRGERLHTTYQSMIASLTGAPENEINLSSAVFAQHGDAPLDDFSSIANDHYGANAIATDFVSNPDAARRQINGWVGQSTKGRIMDLFPSGSISDLTRLVLANAIHFKGTWAEQFGAGYTSETNFMLADGTTTTVQMMSRNAQTGHYDGKGFQAADLAYKGGKLSLLVLLPDAPDGLPALEARLSTELLSRVVAGLNEIDLPLFLPRFELTGDFGLAQNLKALGMERSFSRDADFSGVNGRDDLYLQAVRHKAWMSVDEKGTEAAAATGVALGVASAPPKRFRADHAFAFVIRDRESNAILFMGRLAQP